MAMDLLKESRDDEREFNDICGSIDKERKEAARLVNELLRAARGTADP
jgi:hypothetical protein